MTTTLSTPPTGQVAPGHFDGDGCTVPWAGHMLLVDREVVASLMPGPALHYGVPVVELGEDGDFFGIAGHVAPRRALAAVLRHLRVDAGLDRDDVRGSIYEVKVKHSWVIASGDPESDEPWRWTLGYDQESLPITVVDL